MKAFKVFMILVLVLNIGAAFAEEVSTECSQINDTSIGKESGDEGTRDTSGAEGASA